MQISSHLQIGRGVTALIGGGGKTTLMLTLAQELRRRGTVIVTTSTKIRPPEEIETLLSPSAEEVKACLLEKRVVCVASPAAGGKLGAPELSFEELAALADFVLVEADGAKMLPLKAHEPHEPVIPANAQRVVAVMGIDGIGRPIAEACHRAELYAALAGAVPAQAVTPEMAAEVLKKEGGFDRVYVNKVEHEKDFEAAKRVAALLDCPVTAGSLRMGVYLCLR